MIDHMGLGVSNFEVSKDFYRKALAPLGYEVVMEFPPEQTGGKGAAGFGVQKKPDFWIAGGGASTPIIHLAFHAESRALVNEFYKAAISAGGRDNGPPGIRAHYHANYYGAFVLDPDGHNIEAVSHCSE